MYKVEFKDSSYNKLEFVCKDAVEMCGLISIIYRHTTDENLTFTGSQMIPEEESKKLMEALEDIVKKSTIIPEGFERME